MSNTENTKKDNISPVELVAQAVEKAESAPKKVGLLSIKSANDWIEDSIKMPDPKTFFNGLIVQYENTVIFAASNVGKSILAMQIAEHIPWTEKILYLDLELSSKQFQMRYTDATTGEIHMFPSNFQRAEIDPEYIVGLDLEQEILDSIEEAAMQGTTFFVIDNITFICNDSEKGATAGNFMMKLIRLKRKYGLTIIVIAHTPKRRSWEPITQNDLAGSAKLMNFFDAGIAIARSAKDNNLRYLKQVKVRTGEYKYGADNVIIYDISKDNGCLKFELQGYAKEDDPLKNRASGDDYDEIIGILKLQRDGKTVREIAEILDMSKSSVQRRLDTAKKNNITIPEEKTDPVPPVPSVPHVGQAVQTGQELNLRLQFEEEDNGDEV
jgi:predicted ATP-dependent serine protease